MSLCNCFDDNWVLIAIIVLMLIFLCGDGCNNGCDRNYNTGCGCEC